MNLLLRQLLLRLILLFPSVVLSETAHIVVQEVCNGLKVFCMCSVAGSCSCIQSLAS